MLNWFRNFFGSKKSTVGTAVQLDVERRWTAGKTDRLNEAHWAPATGNSLNEDIDLYGNTLKDRCEYECEINPHLNGVVETHVVDLIGRDGPTLQVMSDNFEYNQLLESLWREWWANPDVNGQLSGADFLELDIRQLWKSGEFLTQITTDEDGETKIHSISPRRLEDPISGEAGVTLGVKRTKTGKPLSYFVQDDEDLSLSVSLDTNEIPASEIIHGFKIKESGQARGVPWAAPALQVAADLKDYDDQVLDAARAAADWALYLYTDHPDAIYVEVNETTSVERRTMRTLPPGWKPQQMQSHQPSVGYVEFRNERLRELGRPVGMPLMTVKLDSSGHNYSSARFDGQNYQRANDSTQGWLERIKLNRLVKLMAREWTLAGKLPPAPENVMFGWVWPKPPHVDPQKEAKASETRLANHTTTLADECAANNRDWETVLEQRAKEKKRQQELEEKYGISFDGNAATAENTEKDDSIDDETKLSEDDVREIVADEVKRLYPLGV